VSNKRLAASAASLGENVRTQRIGAQSDLAAAVEFAISKLGALEVVNLLNAKVEALLIDQAQRDAYHQKLFSSTCPAAPLVKRKK
jgi:hypothetical protein